MKLDPGIHIVIYSVLFLKPGVTVDKETGGADSIISLPAWHSMISNL